MRCEAWGPRALRSVSVVSILFPPRLVRLRSVFVAAVLFATAVGAAAQNGQPYESRFDIPARPSPARLVNDFTGTLSPAERDALERKLVAFDDSTGSQVAVVLVATTDGVAPVDYAVELGREWGVGRTGISDGVVLLVATADREVFITTGFGAEGALTDVFDLLLLFSKERFDVRKTLLTLQLRCVTRERDGRLRQMPVYEGSEDVLSSEGLALYGSLFRSLQDSTSGPWSLISDTPSVQRLRQETRSMLLG